MELWLVEAHYTNMQKCINYVRKYGIQNLKEKKLRLTFEANVHKILLLTQSTDQAHIELHWHQDTKQSVQSYWRGYPHAHSYKIMHTQE